MSTISKLRAQLAGATPGEWKKKRWNDIVSESGKSILDVWDFAVGKKEARANVALVLAMHAALPKLLDVAEAAERLCRSGYDGPFIGEPVEALFSALAALEAP